MRYLLDTDTCIDVLRGVDEVIARLQTHAPEDCRVSAITAYELYGGVEKSRVPGRERAKLERFFSVVEVLPFDQAEADGAGKIRAELESAGTPIGPYGVLIAAHARTAGLILVTRNVREFRRVDGLSVETWS